MIRYSIIFGVSYFLYVFVVTVILLLTDSQIDLLPFVFASLIPSVFHSYKRYERDCGEFPKERRRLNLFLASTPWLISASVLLVFASTQVYDGDLSLRSLLYTVFGLFISQMFVMFMIMVLLSRLGQVARK
jgi:hypothetical protein